jgi:hypothetical protein
VKAGEARARKNFSGPNDAFYLSPKTQPHRTRQAVSFVFPPQSQVLTMLRQSLASSMRASAPGARLSVRRPISRSSLPSISVSSARVLPALPRRWYSAETEANSSKDGEAAKPAADGQEATKTEDSQAGLKKELETKTQEARDWKVSAAQPALHHGRRLTRPRTNTYVRLPISGTCRIGQREK